MRKLINYYVIRIYDTRYFHMSQYKSESSSMRYADTGECGDCKVGIGNITFCCLFNTVLRNRCPI